MISAPTIKQKILDLYLEQPGASSVGLVFGVPERSTEVTGDDPLYKQAIGFEDPVGEFRIDELCGPGNVEFEEEYTMGLAIQVIAKTRDVSFFDVEQRAADMLWQITRILQDPQLGLVDEVRFSRLRVTLGLTEQITGWVKVGNTNLAACRKQVELVCESHIKGALQ